MNPPSLKASIVYFDFAFEVVQEDIAVGWLYGKAKYGKGVVVNQEYYHHHHHHGKVGTSWYVKVKLSSSSCIPIPLILEKNSLKHRGVCLLHYFSGTNSVPKDTWSFRNCTFACFFKVRHKYQWNPSRVSMITACTVSWTCIATGIALGTSR